VTIGHGVYLSVIRGSRLRLEDGVRLDRNAYLVAEGSITIGERTYVGVGATIVAKERIEIGRDGLIAAYATIRDQDHRTGEPDLPYSRQGFITGPIEIGDNVWIGTKATILNGVSIGSNAVIGANAVVTRSIEANVIAGGIPARVIGPVGKGPAGQ
jgi:acetyltransferase-like isoleucine patch superfamily enzyme